MPFRYAPITDHTSSQDRELEASFDADDSDVEDHDTPTESQPLNPSHDYSPPPTATSGPTPYNFEDLDYAYPPPGSPPRPSTFAVPNNTIGNSNGHIPQLPNILRPEQRTGWFRRAAGAILPSVAGGSSNSGRPVGGGIENDGVFANINAKPGRGRIVRDGDSGIYVVPEEVQKESPPSYASAQADAVPPYWETTIHTPAGLGNAGEMMFDGLPIGSLFSFLWNLLVSMSFQFVGFLLTFLLHSTHAAKLGSRAGLGITLIHYGFYLRTRSTSYNDGGDFPSHTYSDDSSWWPSSTSPSHAKPTFGTAAEAEGYYSKHPFASNDTLSSSPSSSVNFKPGLSEGSSEWVSFALMTMGWFILLISALTFWRLKRWERSIMANNPPETLPDEGPLHVHNSFFALERFRFPGVILSSLRGNATVPEGVPYDEEVMLGSTEQGHVLPRSDDPESIEIAGRYAHSRAAESRFHQDLRMAGLL